MTLPLRIFGLTALVLCSVAAWGAANDPYIGYAYPAGGQQGTTFKVVVAGQRLKNTNEVLVSGTGVRATVVGYEGAGGPLNKLQQDELRRRFQEVRQQRLRQFGMKSDRKTADARAKKPDGATPPTPVTLPDLPELRNLEQQSNKQLQILADRFLNPAKRPKPPIAEAVTIDITVDAGAPVGDREIRLLSAAGMSNPLVFQIGSIPETCGGGRDEDMAEVAPQQAPIVLNGQIMPGEVDRFPLQLRRGQKLTVAVQARKLIPYLADAVPGWFQADVSVHDPNGKEIAHNDDCGFVPDPALTFTVPDDGTYTLEIKDAIYRGREDFVYRVNVGDESAIQPLFPLGSRGGVPIGGAQPDWNVCAQLAADHFSLEKNPIHQIDEKEPNDTGQTSMPITMPCIVSGCIAKPGDRDVYSIEGRAGDVVVAEVFSRRMGLAVDSLVRLIDTSGRVVAMNDDYDDPGAGLFTHHADSYLSAKLPANGRYFVQISDTAGQGGPNNRYYMRVTAPRPDFSLKVTPSSLNLTGGRAVAATVCAVRKDGFEGGIQVSLRNAPAGLTMAGGVIPKGRDQVRVTLTAPARARATEPFPLQFEGRAQIKGQTTSRTAQPADNLMQAFAYRHLVPSSQLLAMVTRGGMYSITSEMPESERLRIPAGGSAKVSFRVRPAIAGDSIRLELSEPPAGVTIQDVAKEGERFTLTLKADDKHIGYADNLIVEAFAELPPNSKANPTSQERTVSAGFLPAIPFEIVKH